MSQENLDSGPTVQSLNWEFYSVQEWINQLTKWPVRAIYIARAFVVASDPEARTKTIERIIKSYKKDNIQDPRGELPAQLVTDLSSLGNGALQNLESAIVLWDSLPDYSD